MQTDFLEPKSKTNTSAISTDWNCNSNTGHTQKQLKLKGNAKKKKKIQTILRIVISLICNWLKNNNKICDNQVKILRLRLELKTEL